MARVRAVFFEEFLGPVSVERLPDPAPPPDGVVVEVHATGLCRSDWHAGPATTGRSRCRTCPGTSSAARSLLWAVR